MVKKLKLPDNFHHVILFQILFIVWHSMVDAYDVKARMKVEIKDPKVVQMKNGRFAKKGTYAATGITVMRICGSDHC